MTERILQGPFLTRRQAARKAGVDPHFLPDRPDLIHLGGHWLEEVYCAFQFDDNGIDRSLGQVVQVLHKRHGDEAIADWLVRPNRALHGSCPLDYLAGSGTVEGVLAAAIESPPIPEAGVDGEAPRDTHHREPPSPASTEQAVEPSMQRRHSMGGRSASPRPV